MKREIVNKLNLFLTNHSHFKEECEVVYLMVELRKLLDRKRQEGIDGAYPLVRFYADWTLHIQKDNITKPIKEIMQKIDALLQPYPKDDDISFLLMPEFRKEMQDLLQESGLPYDFCSGDDSWINFVGILSQILADQPIINPTDNISEFYYVPGDKKNVMVTINYSDKKRSITLGFAN